MKTFHITVRTAARTYPTYTAIAPSAAEADEAARAGFDEPCGITVISTGAR
jgi:hypothetical protein